MTQTSYYFRKSCRMCDNDSLVEAISLTPTPPGNDFLAKESILCEWCYFWNECEVKSSNNPSFRVL